MDKNKAIATLNEALAHEWTGFAQYSQQAFVLQGIWREVYASTFRASADECVQHARLIGDKIVALGGVPTIERNQVKQTDELHEMLENSLAFEKAAVKHYIKALDVCQDDRALVVLLEDILLQEQEGVDDIGKLLEQNTGSGAAKKSGKKAG